MRGHFNRSSRFHWENREKLLSDVWIFNLAEICLL